MFLWSNRRLQLYLNRQKIGTAHLEEGFAEMPGAFSSVFVWVISNSYATEPPTFSTLLSPIDPGTLVRRAVELNHSKDTVGSLSCS